ncbi:MAG: peptidylprolyl isomerase [Thaumarchaeota archaeon]|nr:peptidylprolyl isomerase [Nitrososphaerota archaeon]
MKKPGGKKKQGIESWKIVAVALSVLVIVAAGWYVYNLSSAKPRVVYARFETSQGSFDVELFPDSAPRTVANFITLANSGFYDNLVWHRIVKGFVIQTGDSNTRGGDNVTRSAWGGGSSTPQVPFEYDPSLHNYAGYLAMASTGPQVGGRSQFYINLDDSNANSLDQSYAVFGKVLNESGIAVVNALADVEVYQSDPYLDQPVDISQAMLISVRIIPGP